jgi:hypothetical protein
MPRNGGLRLTSARRQADADNTVDRQGVDPFGVNVIDTWRFGVEHKVWHVIVVASAIDDYEERQSKWFQSIISAKN